MEATLTQLRQTLQDTAAGVALRDASLAEPLLLTLHLLGVMLFLGPLGMLILRLLGDGFDAVAVGELRRRLQPYGVTGLILALGSGAAGWLAAASGPLTTGFVLKLGLLLVALAQLWWLLRKLRRAEQAAEDSVSLEHHAGPRFGRLGGLVALLLWSSVIVAARLDDDGWRQLAGAESADRALPASIAPVRPQA